MALPEIYCEVYRWKHFENRLAFGKVIGKSRPFFPDTCIISTTTAADDDGDDTSNH